MIKVLDLLSDLFSVLLFISALLLFVNHEKRLKEVEKR